MYREKQEMMNIRALFHLKAMIEQLRRMQQMSISNREQWAIEETLAQVYERAAYLLCSITLEKERLTPIIYRFFSHTNISDTKPITCGTHYKAPEPIFFTLR